MRKLYAKDTGKNWYVIKTLTLGGMNYQVIDAHWLVLENRWELIVKAI